MQRPLRVLSVSHSGVQRSAGRLRYEALAAHGDIETCLVVPSRWHEGGRWYYPDPPAGEIKTLIEPILLPRGGPAQWYLHHYPRLRSVIERVRPDVLHLWEEPWSVVAAQATWIRNRYFPEVALIVETDQNILRRLPMPFDAIRSYVLGHIDCLIARQDEGVGVCRALGYKGASVIVEYGVDLDTFRPMDRAAVRAELGVSGFTIGYVGRLVPRKGIDDVLVALSACSRHVQLLIMGAGPDRAALEKGAQSLGVAERVRFLEPRPPEGVARFMNALDALVLMSRTVPTWKEQFGRVIIEAQACGVPVIGSSSGAIPSVVGDGGWIVPEGDPGALANLLQELVEDPGRIAAAAAVGRQQVLHRFDFSVIAGSLRNAFLVAARNRKARRCQRLEPTHEAVVVSEDVA